MNVLIKIKNIGRRIRNSVNAFTLTELMVVVIIVGMLAAFGLPSFQRATLKNRERRAIVHLINIHGANEIFSARNGNAGYWPGPGGNLAAINAGLSLNIIDNDMNYSYSRSSPTAYTATAAWPNTGSFTLRINRNAVTATNPCCAAGSCPTRPNC